MFYVSILTKGHGVMVTYIWYVMVQLSDYCILFVYFIRSVTVPTNFFKLVYLAIKHLKLLKRNYNGCILQSGITYYLRGTIIGLNRTYGKPSCKKSVLKKLYFTKLFEKRVIYY